MEEKNSDIITKEDYLKLLEDHDWFYRYSDDQRAWSRGVQEEAALKRAYEEHPELKPLFDQTAEKYYGTK